VAGRGGTLVRKRVKETLAEIGVRPSKQRGQNFLIDDGVIRSIVEFGDPRAGENIIEIGPGLGALTAQLKTRGQLTVIEIEDSFVAELERKYPEIDIVHADVRTVDFSQFGEGCTVFGNLPYIYSTDIIFHLVAFNQFINRAILLLQREFVERLAAEPDSRTYGSISATVQLMADIRLGPIIPGSSFHPPTAVESQLVELSFLKAPRVAVSDLFLFRRVVQAAFFKRRKKLSNSMAASKYLTLPQAEAACAAAKIDAERRAESLDLSEFAALTKAVEVILAM
jgi:16S rRNA (adenine1518-N6/adenine1519-N6)-dimethyltransferase